MLSCHQHPIWEPVWPLAAPLSTQLPVSVLGKAAEDVKVLRPLFPCGTRERSSRFPASGCRMSHPYPLKILGMNKWIDFFMSFPLSLCNYDFQTNKSAFFLKDLQQNKLINKYYVRKNFFPLASYFLSVCFKDFYWEGTSAESNRHRKIPGLLPKSSHNNPRRANLKLGARSQQLAAGSKEPPLGPPNGYRVTRLWATLLCFPRP